MPERSTMIAALRHLIASLATAAALATPAHADGLPDEPIARFEAPVCPGVIGLERGNAEAVVARIRDNIRRLGVEEADAETCEPNLILSVLPDGRDYLSRLRAERGYLFETMDQPQVAALTQRPGPARTWMAVQRRTRDGIRVGEPRNHVDIPQATMWSAHSLIYVPTRRDIASAMVLIDRDAAAGLSVAQIADYATLHGMADYLPPARADVATLQRLFAGEGEAPAALTDYDLAFLDRVYSSLPNIAGEQRLSGLPGMAGPDER